MRRVSAIVHAAGAFARVEKSRQDGPEVTHEPFIEKPFLGLRKVFHVLTSSVVPLLYWYLPSYVSLEASRIFILVLLLVFLAFFSLFDGARLLLPTLNRLVMDRLSLLIRKTEKNKITGATFTSLSFLIVVFLFSREVAVTAMLFLTLGDTAAEIAGKNWGGRKYHGRSLEGMAGFFIIAFPLAWIVLQDWPVALAAAGMGALVEFFSIGVDDNLTVPVGSAISLWLVLSFLQKI
jgi:dolichol kinase